MKYKDNIRKTWEIITEIIGKIKMISNNLPGKHPWQKGNSEQI